MKKKRTIIIVAILLLVTACCYASFYYGQYTERLTRAGALPVKVRLYEALENGDLENAKKHCVMLIFAATDAHELVLQSKAYPLLLHEDAVASLAQYRAKADAIMTKSEHTPTGFAP